MREEEEERCQFCNDLGNVQEQNMEQDGSQGRTMRLCARCRGYIAAGIAEDEQRKAGGDA